MDGLLQAGSTTLSGWLEVTAGPAAGQRIVVEDELRFGCEEPGVGSLEGDRWLSASHAVIRRGAHGLVLEDLRSIEGTKVNGRPVRGAVEIREGDVIELGASRLAMVPPGGSTKPAGADLRNADLRPLGTRRVLAAVVDALVLFPFAFATGLISDGRQFVLIAWLAIWLSYNFLCDSISGQTLGKRLLGLRVVRIDGTPLKPAAVAVRTVLRLADAVWILSVICLLATGKRRQRLGDLAAKTVIAPASTPHAPPARSPRDRQVLLAYPLLWLAPAVLLFVFVPWASLPSCRSAEFQGLAPKEGSCALGGRVMTLVDTGHVLHMHGFDADLVGTRTRPLADGSLISFRVRVRNTGDAPLDLAFEQQTILIVTAPDGESVYFRAAPGDRHAPIAPGASARVSTRFMVPSQALPQLGQPGSGLGFVSMHDLSRFGAIALWDWAGPRGEHALSGLTGD